MINNTWHSILGFYNNGSYLLNNMEILKKGTSSEQQDALQNIELEIEHQGGLSYLAPFAVNELIQLLNNKETLVGNRIEEFLKELIPIVTDYFRMTD